MELAISVFFKVAAEHHTVVAKALQDVAVPTRRESGCLAVQVSQDDQAVGVFHVYSRWAGDSAFQRHLELEHTVGFFAKVRSLLIEPSTTVRLRPLDRG
jgi:quinol monooxygenase YgiN